MWRLPPQAPLAPADLKAIAAVGRGDVPLKDLRLHRWKKEEAELPQARFRLADAA
jgi:hypothetical protein